MLLSGRINSFGLQPVAGGGGGLGAITTTATISVQNSTTTVRFYNVGSSVVTLTTATGNTILALSTDTSYVSDTTGATGSASVNGGYISIASTSSVTFGTGNFTIRGWLFPRTSSYAAGAVYNHYIDGIAIGGSGGRSNTLAFGWFGNEKTAYVFSNGDFRLITSSTLTENAWNHVALVRNASSTTIYINGVSGGNSTYFNSYNLSNTVATIASVADANASFPQVHKFAGFQIFKGTAIYNGNFTPPTRETPLGYYSSIG
jgi:hypothetical protein